MTTKRKKGQTVHSEGRNIIRNIICVCEEEKRRNSTILELDKAMARVALYGDVSEKTVRRIKKEAQESTSSSSNETCAMPKKLSTPGKRRKRAESTSLMDEFNFQVIRKTIQSFYFEDKPRVPSLRKLLPVLQENIKFPYKKETLRKILHKMGYQWKKCGARTKLLIEKPEIVQWRGKYIKQIREYRREGRPIFYIDETCINNNSTFKKSRQSEFSEGVIVDTSSKNRLILVHAVSEHGLLQGSELLFEANSTKGDYHGQMDSANFKKWVSEKLIPSLPPKSVIVMDNAPYHTTLLDKVPTKYATDTVMKNWLEANNIPYNDKMRKFELYELIEAHKPPTKKYAIDELFKSQGHDVLRLPPYMCELNVIQLVWSQIKKEVEASINISGGNFSLVKLQEVTRRSIDNVKPSEAKKYSNHVIKLENKYWETDTLMEDKVDEMIIRLSDEDNSEYDDDISFDESSEEESAESDIACALSDSD
ncbi:uncharacterized protein LOC135838729 isoform X1 [Planococcus citri]|uniref:uncharacterized protein LOC135838729 isoform X1 n=1 Tax=Planococcus citri TaxID=170843 RepID=UPI0031F8C036